MSSDDTDPAQRDDNAGERNREEKPLKRLDRNWTELLQELRVIQAGVQFLTGFLLTLPFQQRFTQLTSTERVVYLVTVCVSIVATAFLQTPVSLHRALFRRHQRRATVLLAHRLTLAGMFFLACAIVGVTMLIFSVLEGPTAGTVAATVAALVLIWLWLVLPRSLRHRVHRSG